ncbi:hypothetical protein [Bacillus haynesii]|uniref:hypothetical protein n=1 Tax=Bacillus TaxID=1386 RepID=UPI00227EAE61|nr:hypothetical protein [Bacillus haynesii]MCY8408978.1 hypothetical protein [Bacillus haynesii]MCY8433473.1 hypothetical protein [Bacillus haynesii]MCY8557847.1 hypothetical protein [Bacillus haynesii]
MTKVYKVEFYVSEMNDELRSSEDVEEVLKWAFRSRGRTHIASIQESKEFEWDDDLPINKVDATTEDHEKFFKE